MRNSHAALCLSLLLAASPGFARKPASEDDLMRSIAEATEVAQQAQVRPLTEKEVEGLGVGSQARFEYALTLIEHHRTGRGIAGYLRPSKPAWEKLTRVLEELAFEILPHQPASGTWEAAFRERHGLEAYYAFAILTHNELTSVMKEDVTDLERLNCSLCAYYDLMADEPTDLAEKVAWLVSNKGYYIESRVLVRLAELGVAGRDLMWDYYTGKRPVPTTLRTAPSRSRAYPDAPSMNFRGISFQQRLVDVMITVFTARCDARLKEIDETLASPRRREWLIAHRDRKICVPDSISTRAWLLLQGSGQLNYPPEAFGPHPLD